MALGIGVQAESRFGQCALFANAGHHILKHLPPGFVIKNVIGRDEGNGKRSGETGDSANPLLVVAAIRVRQRKMEISAKQIGTALNVRSRGFRKNLRKRKNEVLAFRIMRNIGEFEECTLLCSRGDGPGSEVA